MECGSENSVWMISGQLWGKMACLVQLTVSRLTLNESPREVGQAETLQLAKIFSISPYP